MKGAAMNTFQFDVFLSYSKDDEARVRRLAEKLRESGLRVWFDQWLVKNGDDIFLAIERGLEASRTLILCISPAALGSKWVTLERNTVLFRDPTNTARRFIPVLLADCDVPDTIRHYKYVDYRDEGGAALQRLILACSPDIAPKSSISISRSDTSHTFGPSPSEEFVRPLHVTEDRFLQLLLSQFSLRRRQEPGGESFELCVRFDENTPAICNAQAKAHLRSILPAEKRMRYQQRLDDFLLNSRGGNEYSFNDPAFFFRYASGGTLPIIRLEGGARRGEYYCLFYRDVHPIGWNIANGGCDTRGELLNPQDTIERELREELIIANFKREERYVFPSDTRKSIDHPAHAVARLLFSRRFPDKDLTSLKTVDVDIEWFPGPDSLRVQVGNEKPIKRRGFFLNINGEDFGIEFDKVAKIRLPEDTILFDGEIDGGMLVSSPVGLFSVDHFNSQLGGGARSFMPDIFFFSAERCDDGCRIGEILKDEFLPHITGFRTSEEITAFRQCIDVGRQFGLCPVTEQIAKRFLQNKGYTPFSSAAS
jgi:hypothetical protein